MSVKLGMRIPPKIGAEGIEKAAVWAKEAGLDVLDVPRLNPEVKEACAKAGIGIGSVDAAGVGRLLSRDERRRAEAAASIKEQMTAMSQQGGSVMFMCLVPEDPALPRKEGFAIWKESFPDVVRHAESCGVYIAIEGWPGPAPHYPTLGCTPEMWRAMFEAVPSKHFGLNYDPSHLVRLGIDYMRALDEFGERVNHCHGKDTSVMEEELYAVGVLPATFGEKYAFSEGSWRYTVPGRGDVDWGKVSAGLSRLGYDGAVSIELEDHDYWGSLEAERQGIIAAAEHLARHFR
ncbi:sugar phosphate isomerase/epimerase family protein [Paenibacillus humicola]|uniref:sugar phosphate isomerase/epimerase family protein n=1 Tax=Paenibacillus humicola TaxID=3110540 RepID=UPI00237B8D65|nr:sugar phosphate isomerase/epimerase [Paenibacillus humicola]